MYEKFSSLRLDCSLWRLGNDFQQKKKGTDGWVDAGICRLTKEVFDGINNREGSFEEIVLLQLACLSNLKLRRLVANNFYDIGTPSGYNSFQKNLRENLSKTDPRLSLQSSIWRLNSEALEVIQSSWSKSSIIFCVAISMVGLPVLEMNSSTK